MAESKTLYNIYCDESCHLENDHQKVMTIGAIWCADSVKAEMFKKIKEIKLKYGFPADFEVKWTKVSPAKINFYLDLLKLFFDDPRLHFRAVIIKDKDQLDHARFESQNHDVWYYKMFFFLLNVILEPHSRYRIYLDKKDTKSGDKLKKLHDVLCNSQYDFSKEIIEHIQSVHSHEIELLQLADLLIGAVNYANRGMNTSAAKSKLVSFMRDRSGYGLTSTTLFKEEKVNLFIWQPRKGISDAGQL